MQLNTQPVEKQALREDGALEVVGAPWLTIQGEGPFAGIPAVFVRLAGCNLSAICRGCDTDYTSGRHIETLDDLYRKIISVTGPYGVELVVITGGEPMRQGVSPLVNRLVSDDYSVQIETNGTLFQMGLPLSDLRLTVVCSPKTPEIHVAWWEQLKAVKYILRAGEVDQEDGLPTSSLGSPGRPWRCSNLDRWNIYVQPMDEQDSARNLANTRAAVQSCLKFGYRFCPQLHKLPGVELP